MSNESEGMHDTLRRRILRRLEALPEAKLYQVLDYIEFMESEYARSIPEGTSGLQTLAERLEDGLRRRTLSPASLREAFQLISAADRVLGSVAEAGREILAELQPTEVSRREPSDSTAGGYGPTTPPPSNPEPTDSGREPADDRG